MSFEQSLHKKMIKIILWSVTKMGNTDLENSVLNSVKESAKPKIRGIKSFFVCGLNELKRDIKKTQKKSKTE